MDRTVLLEETRDILNKSGFYVSEFNTVQLSGFDLVARRDDTLLIIKILSNIDALGEDLANELKTLSSVLKASILLIGLRDSEAPLENNVIYYRLAIPVITIKTLQHHLLEGIPLSVYAGPGGLYVNIDENRLRQLRIEKEISIGTFARHVNVSRRTVQMYEEGMNTRIDVAFRIEELLESSITLPFDILDQHFQRNKKLHQQTRLDATRFKDFELEILKMLQHVGYRIIPVGKCPFNAFSKDRENLLLTCIKQYNKKLLDHAEILAGLARIIEHQAFLITDRETTKTNLRGTPLINKHELTRIHNTEEVLNLIVERQE